MAKYYMVDGNALPADERKKLFDFIDNFAFMLFDGDPPPGCFCFLWKTDDADVDTIRKTLGIPASCSINQFYPR